MIKHKLHSWVLSDGKRAIFRWKKGYFRWLVMIGDDDGDDSDDGILPSAGPTDRQNDQQISKVTHRETCSD